MSKFDPTTTISAEFGIFGIPLQESESQIVLLPVPWEVTTSYGAGASMGPEIIRNASEQIDLFDFETGKFYEKGIFMREIPRELKELNDHLKQKAQKLIELKTNLSDDTATMKSITEEVNHSCRQMTEWVYSRSKEIIDSGKLLGLIGGDHSTPLGAIRAVVEHHKGQVGVLHIDAHADLRKAYQGFEQSHASIMYNVMNEKLPPMKLVQVGIRDFCEEEFEFSKNHEHITTFYDLGLKQRLMKGESWAAVVKDILRELPQKVYVSFDIDGLDPAFCPHTGTPVPGGLSADQVFFLLNQLADSGRQIVGFDLNEVSTGGLSPEDAEWDGNVGARMLYKLCGWLSVTNNR
ncbi:MAG: agmatinase family protein [Bdellovibrionia bacterium]